MSHAELPKSLKEEISKLQDDVAEQVTVTEALLRMMNQVTFSIARRRISTLVKTQFFAGVLYEGPLFAETPICSTP